MSWIEREEKLLQIHQDYTRESMESVKCYFLYMNRNLYIEQITNENVDIIDGKISKERVLKLIQEKRFQKTKQIYYWLVYVGFPFFPSYYYLSIQK